MAIKTMTLASQFKIANLKTKENISIVFVSKDNKSFSVNVANSDIERTDNCMPNSITLSELPLNNYKIISRIVSNEIYSKKMFSSGCRIIANSIEDKLKSFAIIKELRNCM